jgi:hypothetical protein
LFKLFGLFIEYVCIHCFDCSLVSTFTNETQVYHLLLIWCGWEIHLCGIALEKSKSKSKPKPFSAFCAHPWAFSEPILCNTCDSLA